MTCKNCGAPRNHDASNCRYCKASFGRPIKASRHALIQDKHSQMPTTRFAALQIKRALFNNRGREVQSLADKAASGEISVAEALNQINMLAYA